MRTYEEIKTKELDEIIRLCNYAINSGNHTTTEFLNLLEDFKRESEYRYNKYDNELINNREV